MFLRNAFLSGLSRSVLVGMFLLVVQVLVSFSRDRVQQLLVPSSSPTLFLLEVLTVFSQDRVQRRLLDLITLMCTCPTLPSGCSFVMTPRQSLISGTDALARRCGSRRASESSGSARRVLGGRSLVLAQGYPCQYIRPLCLLSEAHRGEAWHPLTPSWVPLLASVRCRVAAWEFFGSGLFWEVPSSLMFPYSAPPWFYSGYITCVSRQWLLVAISHISV